MEMERLYTPHEVAEYLGFTIQTVQKYMSDGRIKTVKVFNSNRVRESDLMELIKDNDKGRG